MTNIELAIKDWVFNYMTMSNWLEINLQFFMLKKKIAIKLNILNNIKC